MQMLTLKLRTRKLNYPELLSPCLIVIKYLNTSILLIIGQITTQKTKDRKT